MEPTISGYGLRAPAYVHYENSIYVSVPSITRNYSYQTAASVTYKYP